MKKILIFPILFLAGCAAVPNYRYEAQPNDAKLELSTNYDYNVKFYILHPKAVGSLAMIVKKKNEKLVIDVPAKTIVKVESIYAIEQFGSAPLSQCGPLIAVFTPEPNKKYLAQMHFIDNNEGTFWAWKRNQCKLTIIDSETQKSVI